MRTFKAATLGLLGAASFAVASDVVQLTKDDFDSFMNEHDLVLAEFFAPWCGHCKALAPEYEEAATQLKEKEIPLIKVDCTEQTDLCQTQGVEGYPTLKVFRGLETVTPYAGQRKSDAIISYMTKQAMPAVSDLNKDNIEDFKAADKVVVVAYVSSDDKASNETFTSVANDLRDHFVFGATNDPELATAEDIKVPSVVLYKSFDEGKNVFDGAFNKDEIEQFVKTASVPLIGEIGPETYSGYMSAGLPLAYIFAETPEEREKLSEELRPVATNFKGKVNIATIDAKAFGQHGANLNLEVGKWPAFAIQDPDANKKYPFPQDQEITEKDINSFVEEFVEGKLEPSVKSESVPEMQEGPVTIVVAKNYNEIVLDDEKDVLIEFYAPWCGHCKALAPKYDELGSMFWFNNDFNKLVTVAKVDATANDVPEEIQGFPTIKLFPAGKKNETPLEYTGSRTVEDLANFIRDNGSHKIDAFAAQKANETEADAGDMADEAPVDMEDVEAEVGEEGEGIAESIKSAASEAAEVAKEAIKDSDAINDGHDEL